MGKREGRIYVNPSCPRFYSHHLKQSLINTATASRGLTEKQQDAVFEGEARMYFCKECARYFLFLSEAIYIYEGAHWQLVRRTKEVVIFT